jgi:polyhydroxyalkanoate synthesis regulator phasin
MAQNDVLKRYIDAGLAFTALTQTRAEELVKDLVRIGEVQADQARDAVADLLERSRKNSEKLLETVRTEVRQQITSLGIATQADLDKFEQRIASVLGTATAPAQAAAEKARSKVATAKKGPAKKAGAKKAGARKATAKKATAKKATAKKATAKKASAKGASVEKPAKKA